MDLREIKEFFHDTFGYLLVAIIIFILIIYVISFHQVIGPSMNPTLNDGNILIVNKLIYRLSNPKRNDIVEFKHNEKIYIKRVIGLPGESIKYQNHILYVGDTAISDKFADITNDFSLSNLGYTKIPDNYYLVLGDNRKNSEDSRVIGLISKDEIIGRTTIRIWPMKEFGILK